MSFLIEKIDAEKMRLLLQDWKISFSKKKKVTAAKVRNAESIVEQMIDSLRSQKHGHLWLAKHETSKETCAVLIGDDHKDGFIIRFVLSNILDEQTKGSGRFLVQEMMNLADKRNFSIRTTSQNADKFWKGCPGFQLDRSNPTDYIYKPNSLTSQSFFKNPPPQQETKKNGPGRQKFERT